MTQFQKIQIVEQSDEILSCLNKENSLGVLKKEFARILRQDYLSPNDIEKISYFIELASDKINAIGELIRELKVYNT